MSAEISFTKRAAAELSRCFNGITVSRSSNNSAAPSTSSSLVNSQAKSTPQNNPSIERKNQLSRRSSNSSNGETKQLANGHTSLPLANKSEVGSLPSTPQMHRRRSSRNGPPPKAPPKTVRARRWNYLLNLRRSTTQEQLWQDSDFLHRLFQFVEPIERAKLAQVCKNWSHILYSDVKLWKELKFTIYFNELRRPSHWTAMMMRMQQNYSEDPNLVKLMTTSEANKALETLALAAKNDHLSLFYRSIKQRRFETIQLFGANDADLIEFSTQAALNVIDFIHDLSVQNSPITDKGVEVLLASIATSLLSVEFVGCNELSDSGLWTGLVPNLKSLTIKDCINVSDETVAAICQLLPALNTLNIQAYHVTDASMTYFSTSMLRETLRVLVLQHCWEITNQGVVNLAHSLPNLVSLSLSGCSKVSDEAIEVVAEQLRNLHTLDLSWCPRVSDAALEFIACDLAETLKILILDRCLHVTDIGIGYVATMARLENLSIRWCPLVRDFGMQTLSSLRSLKTLSIAGCSHVTITGLSFLVRLQQLEELELTNCPAASKDLVKYLVDNLPTVCTIIT